MTFIRAALGVTLLAAMSSLHAADKPCAPADAKQAEKVIDNVITWPQMYKAYVDYVHCDTGPVGELYTDSLLRLLVEWKNPDALGALVQKDPKFKEFAFTHLKQPASKDDRSAIYSRATHACPKAMDAFCVELAAVVNPK
jgi:hypothetical protein